MTHEHFDVIVIGAGQGGGPIASAFAEDGRKTALIEREYPGGTCINWGCTPSKTMIASGRVAHLVHRATDYGINTGDVTIDMKVVRQRVRDIVASFRKGSRSHINQTDGLEYIEGEAQFTDDNVISVAMNAGGTRELRAETMILDVGERFRQLDLDIPRGITLHSARTIMEIDEVPNHLAIVGGGPVALEFGQLFRRLGADVTILNRGPRILSGEDPDIANAVTDLLTEDGITIRTNTSPVKIAKDGMDIVITTSKSDESNEEVRVSHVLVAAGRVPNTDTLYLERSGVEVDKHGYVPTNNRLETNIQGIFAIGDIRQGPKFTHISYDDFRILKANLIDGEDRTIDSRLIVSTTFIDPQLGRIGLSESEANTQGIPYLIAKMPMESIARALETDETRGFMKVIVHAETERILGAVILGIEGGELAAMLQIAMMGDLPYMALRDGVFAHPTLAESLNNLFSDLQPPDH